MIVPHLIEGDVFVDDRGTVSFVNDFSLDPARRFYMVENHSAGFVRAWHYHAKETKYVLAVAGSAIVAAVHVTNVEEPDSDSEIYRFVLSAKKPSILLIPPEYAHGTKNLTDDTRIMFFSNATLEESSADDIRYDAEMWNPWDVLSR